MARSNDRTSTNFLFRTDVTTARWEYTSTWTYLQFFQAYDLASDENGLISKGGVGTGGTQIRLRTAIGTSPTQMEVRGWGLGNQITATLGTIYEDTWYLWAMAHNGSGGFDWWVYGMDGATVDSGTSLTLTQNASDLTHLIRILKGTDVNDPMDGAVAHVCYFDGIKFTAAQVKAFLRHPALVAAQYGAEYYIPMIEQSGSEVDLSGNKRSFSEGGTVGVADNPPVSALFGFDIPIAIGGEEITPPSTETLRPDGELSDVNLVANDYTDHDEDPDSVSVTIAATGNNVSTEYGVDFPTPSGDPTVVDDLQEFRV